MRSVGLLVCVLAGLGCEKKESRIEGPMPVTFGDCAGPNTAWLSGPRPAEFALEQAGDVVPYDPKAVPSDPAKTAEAPPPADEPPPPEEPDEGTAMALEEGKMGGRDAARQQALEQARNAGVLGSTALQEGGAFASLTGTGDISSGVDDTDIYGGLLGNEAGEMEGGYGFGRTGVGQANGGTGWGTIGTGRYGTIGHGSGTGYGVGKRRNASVPSVSIGQPNAQGDLDKAIIRRYIKRNLQKIQYCYEKELLVKPKLAGTVTTQFFITPNGDVASASGSGMDPNVASCVAGVIKNIEFPKPKGGGGVQVNYPFTFRPANDTLTADAGSGSAAEEPREPAAGSGSAMGGGSAAPPAAAPPPPPPPGNANPDGYRPGQSNPLRSEGTALETCFRKGKNTFGAAVFDFAYDASGAVTKVDVHGITDDRVKKCVLGIAKKVKAASPPKAERCSLSFGVMPVAQAPSVDIKADVVTFNGGKVESTAALMMEQDFKIPVLFEMLDARRRVARGSVVSIHGPLVIKAIDTAKMGVVNKVLHSILLAGDDFVLGKQAGADFQLFTPMELPVVPVPFGTGAMWSRPSPRGGAFAALDERVTLSVLVQQDKIWVGLSRVNEFQELPRDMTRLGQALAEHKKSAFFADRTDIEVAGDPDANYIDVLNAITAAQVAGFTRWQLVDPHGLSARPFQ